MWVKIIIYVVVLYFVWKVIKYLSYKLTVRNTGELNSIAATASLYVIDEILSKFMNDKRLKDTNVTYEESLNYAYEMSAISFGYLTRLAFHILDTSQFKFFTLKLEKWIKARLAYRGSGNYKNTFAALAYEYSKYLISRQILIGNDGVLILIQKYNLDPNTEIYKLMSNFYDEIIDYIHDNYEDKLVSITNNKEVVEECKK